MFALRIIKQTTSKSRFFSSLSSLPINRQLAEYVWIGGSGQDLRCKTRTLPADFGNDPSPSDFPDWNYDGSSTGQAPGDDSEVIIRPRRVFRDPFREGDNFLVMCDTHAADTGEPIPSNTRAPAEKILAPHTDQNPHFSFEQEYVFMKNGRPFGWPEQGYPEPQGPYYCGVGASASFGRQVVEEHYRACLYAGIAVSGVNAEVMASQWEFQVGPVTGIDAGDQMWMARYLLQRIAEMHGLDVSIDPKPMEGDWNGSGCHINICIKDFHKDNGEGYKSIEKAIEKLKKKHDKHIAAYGEGNERRLTGLHETASIDTFTSGVADRGASIRIPRATHKKQKGYIEDRRPSSSCDPYTVSSLIIDTILN